MHAHFVGSDHDGTMQRPSHNMINGQRCTSEILHGGTGREKPLYLPTTRGLQIQREHRVNSCYFQQVSHIRSTDGYTRE